MTTYIILMAVLVLLSAFFSATETAFSSMNKTRMKTLAEKGNRKAALACRLAERYDKLISTILVGNNIVNIATASIGTVIFVRQYGDAGATISTVVVTVVVLIFGEISPKSIAKDCPERFAMFAAPVIQVLVILLTPVNYLFSLWKKLLAKLFRLQPESRMSQDELLMLVDEVQQGGSIDPNEGELLRNAIEFSEQQAEDIITHRVDLEAVPITADKTEVAKAFSESRFSRLLVYDESIDNIVGVIHQKDFYIGSGITDKPLPQLVTPVTFVPKSEKISELLRQLQQTKSHLAVVVDEYGGTYGIVTMEDILEELVGEIWDEHDEVTEDFHPLDSGAVRINGAVDLDDFCDYFDLKTDSEMVSLGGWVTEQLGHIPAVGDHFTYAGLTLRVTRVASHRVVEVEVQKIAVPADSN